MSVPRPRSPKSAPTAKPASPPPAPAPPASRPAQGARGLTVQASTGPTTPGGSDMPVGVAVSTSGNESGTVTARRAGGLRDMGLEVSPRKVGVPAALQHLAKAVNIAFQSDFGENSLETVYQAAIVRRGQVHIIHKEYFGFGDNWFGEFGRFIRTLELTLEGPDPASPEGRQRIIDKGPASIRGLINLIGRKLDIITEYEDKVPAYVEQMFDRLEGSGIILGWDRNDWDIATTTIGLDIRITPKQ